MTYYYHPASSGDRNYLYQDSQKHHNPKNHNNSFNRNDSVAGNTGHAKTWNYVQLCGKDKKFKMWLASIYSIGECIRCVLMGGGGNKKELRTELACWKSCSSWGKPGPGVARRKTRAGRGRLGGRRRSSEKRKRWREEEEEEWGGRKRRRRALSLC